MSTHEEDPAAAAGAKLAQVAALADSVTRMREAQGRAAQAAAARRASEALQGAYSARNGTAQLAQAAAAARSLDGITQQQPWVTNRGRIR